MSLNPPVPAAPYVSMADSWREAVRRGDDYKAELELAQARLDNAEKLLARCKDVVATRGHSPNNWLLLDEINTFLEEVD